MTVRNLILIAGCVIAAGFFNACSDDFVSPPPPEPIVFRNLQQKDDVLFNLELAYNERNFTEYDKLLDDNFEFYFGFWDYQNGIVPNQMWERADEAAAHTWLFVPNSYPSYRYIRMELELDYPSGNWIEEPPEGGHPEETWYVKTVVYRLEVETAAGWRYRALGLTARFKVRLDESGGGDVWRIVEWRDDVGTNSMSKVAGDLGPRSTWGAFKSASRGI